jgi:hypothetical protein
MCGGKNLWLQISKTKGTVWHKSYDVLVLETPSISFVIIELTDPFKTGRGQDVSAGNHKS